MLINVIKPQSNYGALRHHADCIAAALTELGHSAKIVDIERADEWSVDEMGSRFVTLNLVGVDLYSAAGAFFDNDKYRLYSFNVDHPVFMLTRILQGDVGRNVTSFYLDETHVELTRRIGDFTGFAQNAFLPPGAMPQPKVDWSKRHSVLFTGGYPNPRRDWGEGNDFREILDGVADLYLAKPESTIEASLKQVLIDTHTAVDEALILKLLLRCQPVYKYVQGLHRKALFDAIGNVGVKIHAYGNGWERCTSKDVEFVEPGDYARTLEIQKEAKLVINSNNGFTQGGHERVFAAQMNGCAVFSDWNPFYEAEFGNDAMVFYRFSDLKEAADIFADVANDDAKLEEIAVNGQRITQSRHSWLHRVETLVRWMNEDGPSR